MRAIVVGDLGLLLQLPGPELCSFNYWPENDPDAGGPP